MKQCFFLITLLGSGVVLLAGGCNSQTPIEGIAASAERSIEPEADEALRKMSDTLGNMKTFSFTVEGVMDERQGTGQCVAANRYSEILVDRPNKIYVDTEGDDLERSVWYNGSTFTVLDKLTNVYTDCEVPDSIDSMIDHLVDKYGLTMPVADVLSAEPYETLIENVQEGTYVGLHTVDGHRCHHLLFEQEEIDWQIWIDAGQDAVPRKVLIIYKLEPDAPQYSAMFSKWSLSEAVSLKQFEFQPPEGAERTKIADFIAVDEGE
jgi:hypothetical protein